MVAAQAFLTTTGGNIYPDPATEYDQSEAFRKVALNRDVKDGETAQSAVSEVLSRPELFKNTTVVATHDWDTDYTPGNKYTGNPWASDPVNVQNGLAEQIPSNVIVGGSGSKFTATQMQISVTGELRIYVRSKKSSTSWTPWANILESGGGGGSSSGPTVNYGAPAGSHELRAQAFKDVYPVKSTGNKGVVCFRYDHGLTNFKATLLAMHQAAGIPFYIAMNSRLWAIEENSGATQTDVKAWIASGLCEIGNHTSDHIDRNTAEGIYDTIVNGRKELESQLGITVHGFTVPGLTEFNKFEGFNSGSLDSYSETLAGGLILANHGICSGAIGNTHRKLDGIVRQGGRHYTWEKSAWADLKTQIDTAVTNKTALTIMAHPRNLGTSGYFTASLAQQAITYVKSLIDAGQLANMSYYQSHHATL